MNIRSAIANPVLLRRVFAVDAILTGAVALAMCLASGPLAAFTGLPAALLLGAGLVLIPFVAWVAWLARHPHPSPLACWAVVAINTLWEVDCLALLASGWVSPNAFGVAFVLIHAATAGVFAVLGALALVRAPAATLA